MNILYEQALKLLEYTKKYPQMFATTHEAMCSRICSILEMAEVDTENFYTRHIRTYGSIYIGLQDEITNEWAKIVIEDALFLLDKKYHESESNW